MGPGDQFHSQLLFPLNTGTTGETFPWAAPHIHARTFERKVFKHVTESKMIVIYPDYIFYAIFHNSVTVPSINKKCQKKEIIE
jgi:hypothetical protein